MEDSVYLGIEEVLPDVEPDFDAYAKCEREVLTPALESAGFTVSGNWFTGDGDSFGPLTRCVHTDKGVIIYG